jgi:biofilm PGA synthesis N-glycosyltransferase PgaC
MSVVAICGWILVLVSLGSVALFALYPLLVSCMPKVSQASLVQPEVIEPTVTLLVAVRNGEALIEDKVANSLALDYPKEHLQLLFVSDGSTDNTVSMLRAHEAKGIEVLELEEFGGKIEAMNRAIPECRGDIVVFSDADALPRTDALRVMLRHFRKDSIGGVCGQRTILDDSAWAEGGQANYIAHDSRTKELESSVGSITSNDGKLYAIRRSLYQPIPPAVTDDLFVCLSVVRQGYRFVFDRDAVVHIRIPSRSRAHEFERRRRIVSTSLRGIREHRVLLNPLRYGGYSLQLFINKVMRRLLPFYVAGVLVGWGLIATAYPLLFLPLALIMAGIVISLLWPATAAADLPRALRAVADPMATIHYICLGIVGMACGVIDFIAGRYVVKWEPNKGAASRTA